ncbi:hypothetical protein CRG98_001702 [Punica granatum]|uniref:RING-type domain-containing protein n=1 Tax=Punica granatum TaxID=22663 RepID=A0A2I0LB45_PUNGR|nr:hypothetical protein CRG98_001702 [Punica granatum]
MATLFFSLLLISCSLIQSFVSVTSLGECSASCGDGGPAVQFPFSLTNTWADGCGHISRYGLRCENSTRQVQPWLILDVPTSGEFVVNNINYTLKTISINDPGGCLPRRFLGNFTPPTYPFWITTAGNWYTFLNCTANFHIQEYAVIACLSDENFTVLAAPLDTSCPRFSCVGINMAVCKVISVTYVPFEVGHPDDPSFGMNFNQDIMLAWDPPSCAACELRGGTCGFNKSSDDSIGCLHVHSHASPDPQSMVAPAAAALGPISLSTPTIITLIICFLSLPQRSTSFSLCKLSTCGGGSSLYPMPVRFPFRLRGQQDDPRCSYSPAFDLSCDSLGQTIITLPGAGEFAVDNIDYQAQTIVLSDPDACLPRRLLNNTSLISGNSAFQPVITRKFMLLNCSTEAIAAVMYPRSMTVLCLSEENFTVISVPSRYYDSSHECEVLGSITVPLLMPYWRNVDCDIRLTWDAPDCRSCEELEGQCGFKNDNGSEVGCIGLSSSGLPRAAKYGLILGAGIPGLLCLIGLMCFVSRRIRTYHRRSEPTMEFSAMAGPRPMLLSVGLDGPTIESYPMTQLGESKRLPKPNDNTCSICLCEYQPKETLRTIPECNHYFHVNCIDEWLRLNASCPLCRNLPEPSLQEMPSSSLSSSTALAPPA